MPHPIASNGILGARRFACPPIGELLVNRSTCTDKHAARELQTLFPPLLQAILYAILLRHPALTEEPQHTL